ncbi:hypothetical protein Tdes44962_MAKER02038 [Teratosphaeria destructans]|uniref:Uncharacterized protein n=1 Tax=Teratosphaeria destructans TaxID=418781 RepID=A0A9W7SVJ9_9PEZI|nr:hypothetical protein Tdes44962_MAKER02038 [Teratosphaeria destructans]
MEANTEPGGTSFVAINANECPLRIDFSDPIRLGNTGRRGVPGPYLQTLRIPGTPRRNWENDHCEGCELEYLFTPAGMTRFALTLILEAFYC